MTRLRKMKSDIQIPEVKDVYVAVVQEYNAEFEWNDWNAYIINDRDTEIEMVLVVSKGYDQDRETSVIRHNVKHMPAKSYARIELMQEGVLALNNEFRVSFFVGNTMYDKKYVFKKNTINSKALRDIPLMRLKGVLVK